MLMGLNNATKRKRSSSLPSPTARLAVQNHTLSKFAQSPHVLPRSVAEPHKGRPFSPTGHIGPRRRAPSDPTLTYPDTEDGDGMCGSRDDDASWTDDHSTDDPWESERTKDTLRRFHALEELLATEVGYLADLRFLVTVYLRSLPTIVARSLSSTSAFGRASASLAAGTLWMHSHYTPPSSALSDPQITPESSFAPAKDASFNSRPSHSRFVFTDHEIELLTRNGEVLLQLHEHFVDELRTALEPLGYSIANDRSSLGPGQSSCLEISGRFLGNLGEAIRVVSTKFATEASRFNAYQSFCAGHPEAMDVLRKAFQHFPLELELFERRCSSIVSNILENSAKSACSESVHNNGSSAPPGSLPTYTVSPPALEDRKRALSLTSLDSGNLKSKSPYPSNSLKLRASTTAITMTSMMDSNTKEREKGSSENDRKAADVRMYVRMSNSLSKSWPAGGGAVAAEPTLTVRGMKDRSGSGARKIVMADYMIKPVQRICKYPLLLDQLLPSKVLRPAPRRLTVGSAAAVEVVVASAAQAMRHVASSVNEARDRYSVAIQSSLIVSRICLGLQVQPMASSPFSSTPVSHSSHPSTPPPTYASLFVQTQSQSQTQSRLPTRTFLSSLGPCLLSGSLDVIYSSRVLSAWSVGSVRAKSKIKAKYLGALLYNGGYLILVKVGKGKYEPRHWFSLSGWDVLRVDDENAMLPNSFRLSKAEQHFELAASCQREQDVWLNCICEALNNVPTWIAEPLPSFMSGAMGSGNLVKSVSTHSASTSDDGHVSIESADPTGPDGLPTIVSIPGVTNANALDGELTPMAPEPFFASLRGYAPGKAKTKLKEFEAVMTVSVATTFRQGPKYLRLEDEDTCRQTRRSASASVKNIFTPINMAGLDREKDKESEPETILVTRSSTTARQAVDLELQDIMSATCLSARAEAAWREKNMGSMRGSARAKASVGMGTVGRGMARLSKHESVRVPRKTASMEITIDRPSNASGFQVPGRKNIKKLSLASISLSDYDKPSPTVLKEPFTSDSASRPPDTSFPPTQPSSANILVDVVSSVTPMQPPASPSVAMSQCRSFVRNVKGLFHFRSNSPSIPSPFSVVISQPSQGSLRSLGVSEQNNSSRNLSSANPNHIRLGRSYCRRSKNMDLEESGLLITSIWEDNEATVSPAH